MTWEAEKSYNPFELKGDKKRGRKLKLKNTYFSYLKILNERNEGELMGYFILIFSIFIFLFTLKIRRK